MVHNINKTNNHRNFLLKMIKLFGAVMAVIVWYLDLQLPMQSVPITIDIMSSNLDQGEMTTKFVSD